MSRDDWENLGSILSSLTHEYPGEELDQVYDFRGAGELISYVENQLVLGEDEFYADHPDLEPLECPDCVDEDAKDAEIDFAYFAEEVESFRYSNDIRIVGYWEGFCRDHNNDFMQYDESWYISE